MPVGFFRVYVFHRFGIRLVGYYYSFDIASRKKIKDSSSQKSNDFMISRLDSSQDSLRFGEQVRSVENSMEVSYCGKSQSGKNTVFFDVFKFCIFDIYTGYVNYVCFLYHNLTTQLLQSKVMYMYKITAQIYIVNYNNCFYHQRLFIFSTWIMYHRVC